MNRGFDKCLRLNLCRRSHDQLLATIDYMLASLEMLPLKLTRLQLLRAEAAEYHPSDPTGDTAPLFNDLEAIEEVFVDTGRA